MSGNMDFSGMGVVCSRFCVLRSVVSVLSVLDPFSEDGVIGGGMCEEHSELDTRALARALCEVVALGSVRGFVGDVQQGVGGGSGVEPRALQVHKVKCGRCGFFVNPDGHDERCAVVLRTPQWVRTVSWMGGTLLSHLLRMYASLDEHSGLLESADVMSNDRLASVYDRISPVSVSSQLEATGTSKTNRAMFLKAAFALSYGYRVSVMHELGFSTPRFMSCDDVNLYPVIHGMYRRGDLGIVPSENVAGYCYMSMVRASDALQVAKKLGPFPDAYVLLDEIKHVHADGPWYLSHKCAQYYHVSNGFMRDSALVEKFSDFYSLLFKGAVVGIGEMFTPVRVDELSVEHQRLVETMSEGRTYNFGLALATAVCHPRYSVELMSTLDAVKSAALFVYISEGHSDRRPITIRMSSVVGRVLAMISNYNNHHAKFVIYVLQCVLESLHTIISMTPVLSGASPIVGMTGCLSIDFN